MSQRPESRRALVATGLLWSAIGTLAQAQGPAPPDLEPAVRTSSAAAVTAPAPAATAPAAASVDATPPKPADRGQAVKDLAAKDGSAAKAAPKDKPPAKAAAAAQATGTAQAKDRIQLETTEISGNRELPKVMYIVPWRRADLGDFAGRPPNSLLDEALAPVDRDVFRRQNRYYAALQAGADKPSSDSKAPAAAPGGQDEK